MSHGSTRNEAFIYEIKDFLYLDKKIPIEATRRNKMEETISLKELFQTLKKRMSLIVLITAIAVMVSAIVSFFFLTPIYQSSTQLLVNQAKNEQQAFTTSEVQTNLQLINTYNVIIKSPAILDKVAAQLGTDLTSCGIKWKNHRSK